MKNVRTFISAALLTTAAVGQIALAVFLYNSAGSAVVGNIGYAVLWLSAAFGWLPLFTLRKYGGVPAGKGYVHTTRLVDRGVYGLVRHPQYLAGMLLAAALTLIARHWLVAVPGAVVVLLCYLDTFAEERSCFEKFGEEYRRYTERVPRVNFLPGILRRLPGKR
jgi:protein-S-isoprenylcysteine O-methyltransferase Ste14